MQWFADRRFLIIALIFLLLTWVMFVTSRERESEGKVEYFFNTAMAPLESIFNYCGMVLHDSWKTVTRLAQLKVENDLLRKEIERLKTRQLTLEQLQKENEELRQAAGFVKAQTHEMVAAEVISVNPGNWSRTLTINRGKNDGLKKNMAVISPKGVVGRILEVRDYTAEVILLTDPRDGNYIGGMVKRTQNMAIVTGGGEYLGECTVRPAVDNFFSDLKENDIIITAATSDLFPRGIPIGRVVKVSYGPNKMVAKAILRPAVKFNQLRTVFVIKRKDDSAEPFTESSAIIPPGGE